MRLYQLGWPLLCWVFLLSPDENTLFLSLRSSRNCPKLGLPECPNFGFDNELQGKKNPNKKDHKFQITKEIINSGSPTHQRRSSIPHQKRVEKSGLFEALGFWIRSDQILQAFTFRGSESQCVALLQAFDPKNR